MHETTTTEQSPPTHKEPSCDTDSSPSPKDSLTSTYHEIPKVLKKKIGPFSYRLNDVIGSGFTSKVYRGYKSNDKSSVVAIKVISLESMRPHRRQLLEN